MRIGYQARPEIFARHIVLPEQPYEKVVEIVERVGADGELVTPLDEDAARLALRNVRESGIDALAIVLMHGWKFTDHEQRVAEIARELGFAQVSVSHEVAPWSSWSGAATDSRRPYLSPILRATSIACGRTSGGNEAAVHAVERGLTTGGFGEGRDPVRPGAAWSAWCVVDEDR